MFSHYFSALSRTRKIAYTALFVALSVVANSVLDIDLTPQNKITFTYLVLFLSAYFLGALPSFLVGFAGDGLGYLIMPDGNYWFYGITLGLMGFTAGILLRYLPFRGKSAPYLKTAVVCIVCYLLFTVCLNSLVNYTYAWAFFWGGERNKSLWVYLAAYLPPRLAIQTAVYAGNFAVCFALLPLLTRLTRRAEKGKKEGDAASLDKENPRNL